tara:strand:+ start:82 stop:963 length:882 start_codon:yes stop_codon:yes gene_type:complete
MSLPYSKFPVYIGQPGGSIPPEVQSYIPATQVNVNYNTNNSPNRKQGVTPITDQFGNVTGPLSDAFGFNGPLNADISINCIFHTGMMSGLNFLKDPNQDNFVTITLGSEVYKKCYAKDVSVNISPFAPVTLNANFVSLVPASGGTITGDNNPYAGSSVPLDSEAVAYGHTCFLSAGNANVLNDTQSQITFKRSYTRSPVVNIGSATASEMLLDGIEEEMTIASTGLQNLISFSGDALSTNLQVFICGVGGTAVMPDVVGLINFTNESRVLAESYSTQGGETLTTSATIKQIKL